MSDNKFLPSGNEKVEGSTSSTYEETKESIPYDYEIILPQIRGILGRLKALQFTQETYNSILFLDYSLPRFVREDIRSDVEDMKEDLLESREKEGLSKREFSKRACTRYFRIIKEGLEDHGFLRESTSLTKETL